MHLRRLVFFVFAFLSLLPASAWAGDSDQQTVAELKDLVSRQNALFGKAEKAGENVDVDNLQSQLQQLCQDYDKLLNRHPDFAPAYVAYGLLLGKVDMRKESAALLLKANQLDKEIPVVKNQLGNYLAEEGKPLEAVNYFLAAIDLAPKEPLYHYQLGTLLTVARDDFLKSGHWTRPALDKAMQGAFARAAELSPDNVGYSYRYGESFYDLEQPNWDEALAFWRGFESKVASPIEKQTGRLHAANVLLKQKKVEEARSLLATVTEEVLQKQKEKLVAQFPAEDTK
jgi:tetratricopeptide (TPR) repeat protein